MFLWKQGPVMLNKHSVYKALVFHTIAKRRLLPLLFHSDSMSQPSISKPSAFWFITLSEFTKKNFHLEFNQLNHWQAHPNIQTQSSGVKYPKMWKSVSQLNTVIPINKQGSTS